MALSPVMDSFSRCSVNPKFLDRFYDIFLSSNPTIAPMFKNTDFAKQKRLIRAGITMVMMHADGNKTGTQALDRIAQSHGRHNLNIAPSLYPYWIDSLIKAVQECDPQWDGKLEVEWRAALRKGTDHITAQY
ncbi:MAG: globin [Nitrospira sp.]|nr:globin [Nitrospira sp.]